MGTIIAGFPCIGKTTIGKRTDLSVIDIESTRYKYLIPEDVTDLESIKLNVTFPKNPDWPENYLNAIAEASKVYDIVFVLGKYDFNQLMLERGYVFFVAFPDPSYDQKQDYLNKAKQRSNPQEFMEIFSKNFEKWQARMDSLPVPKIKLKKGEYISDALLRLGILQQTNASKPSTFDK